MFDISSNRLVGPQRLVADADSARDTNDWHKASRLYKGALELVPEDPTIWVQYGHALKESGQIGAAEAAYRKSVALAPNVSDTHLQLGNALKLLGKLDDARSDYAMALTLDSSNIHAAKEFSAINEIDGERCLQSDHIAATSTAQKPRVVFDCSDLVEFFLENRLPTGIQRVQINIVTSYIAIETSDVPVIVFFDIPMSTWREIVPNDFRRLVNSALRITSVSERAWEAIRSQICGTSAHVFRFVGGDTIVNFGTSWWIPDYFMRIRDLKAKCGIFYLPFIHDCIPLITPEYCDKNLTEQFRAWLAGVFAHSDGFLVNSQSTAHDLVETAKEFSYTIAAPTVVRLDGDTCNNGQLGEVGADAGYAEAIFARERIPKDVPYVLMVSTLEARKNHILALQVWDRLLGEHGDKCPYLMCVGKKGWRFDLTMEYFVSRKALAKRVRFVSNVGDAALAQLYRRALFTFYPSHYEGWGLPVTESLCYGKLPVVADNSSLTEAGGEFADYFESGSARHAHAAVARLLEDPSYRTSREADIASRFKPRSWTALAQEVADSVERLRNRGLEPVSGVPSIVTGRIWLFKQYSHVSAASGKISAEHCRMGSGWYACEDWGTWMSATESNIGFVADRTLKDAALYVHVRGNPVKDLTLTISRLGTYADRQFSIQAKQDRHLKLDIGDIDPGSRLEFLFGVDQIPSLSEVTSERDQRKIGLGLIWLAVTEDNDLRGRLAILEAIGLQPSLSSY